jgi:purine-binding chemotaxis protein CheW
MIKVLVTKQMLRGVMSIDNIAVLLCRVDGRLCALYVSSILETMRPLAVEPMAKAPDFVLGLSIIRGVAVPVVDLGRLLGGRAAQLGRFVTVKAGARVIALAVDAVLGVRELSANTLQALPPLFSESSAEVTKTIGILDQELLFILQSTLLLPGGLLAELTAEGPTS